MNSAVNDCRRVYKDIRNRLVDLEYQIELVANDLVKKMAHAYESIPYELRFDFAKATQDDKSENPERYAVRARMLIDGVFGQEFLDSHKVELHRVSFLMWDMDETYFLFTVDGKDAFQVTIPNPERHKLKDAMWVPSFKMTAHILKGGVASITTGHVKTYETIDGKDCSSYDWRAVFKAIESHYSKGGDDGGAGD